MFVLINVDSSLPQISILEVLRHTFNFMCGIIPWKVKPVMAGECGA